LYDYAKKAALTNKN